MTLSVINYRVRQPQQNTVKQICCWFNMLYSTVKPEGQPPPQSWSSVHWSIQIWCSVLFHYKLDVVFLIQYWPMDEKTWSTFFSCFYSPLYVCDICWDDFFHWYWIPYWQWTFCADMLQGIYWYWGSCVSINQKGLKEMNRGNFPFLKSLRLAGHEDWFLEASLILKLSTRRGEIYTKYFMIVVPI